VKLPGPTIVFVGRVLMAHSVSSLVTRLLRFSISSEYTVVDGVSRNLPVSSTYLTYRCGTVQSPLTVLFLCDQ